MKNYLSLTLLFFIFYCFNITELRAQLLPNSGFEQWDSSGQPAPFDWHQPSDWSSTNPVTEFNSAGITKTTDSHSGNFAAQIKSQNIFGTQHAGGLVCGHAKTSFSDYTILPITGGETVGSKPKKLKGFYKFSSPTSGDSACVIAINKKWNSSITQPDTIGFGILKLPPSNTYIQFELIITDWNTLVNPDSVVVAFFSSNPDTGLAGSTLIIDDVELDFETNIESVNDKDAGVQVFPNPASDRICVIFNRENNFTQLNFYSLTGKIFYTENISEKKMFQIATINFPSGIYWIELKKTNGDVIRKKIIKVD